ncbi:MAG TPA: hypothetical protein VIK18_26050 [Pirellulales bacterium]
MSVAHRKFTDVLDLLLVGLYHFARDLAPAHFLVLDAVNRHLRNPVPTAMLREAGKVLQSRRLVQCMFPLGGRCYAKLTGEGRMYVEEKRGSGITEAYWNDPSALFINFSGPSEAADPITEKDLADGRRTAEFREPALEIVDSIKSALRADESLDDQTRSDALSDIDVVFHQLMRIEPNLQAIAAILAPLADIGAIAEKVANLVDALNS